MNNSHSRFRFNFITLTALVILLTTSCIPQKKLRYLQQLEESQTDTVAVRPNNSTSYQIKAKDELYIKVNSLNPKTFTFFNGSSGTSQQNMMNNDLMLYLNSYTVNDSGYVDIPVVGQVKLIGLTIKEASLEIEKSLKKYLTEVSVIVKLANFRVTLLGEVKRPGRYIDYVSQMNILEALALGGDMTPYGNRERVFLIREEDGKEKIYFLNLLDQNIVNDPNYNLLPNDIIYVESLDAKTWGFESFPYTLILSTLTTFIAMTTLILQLKN
jgi:polysaccharide export outer membrane protein